MKLLIIGGGFAGYLAHKVFSDYNPLVFEASEEAHIFKNHKAVLRFKDPKITRFFYTDLELIQVYKQILYKEQLYSNSNIIFNNLYSRKLYGCIGMRSLNNLGLCERIVLKDKDKIRIPAESLFYNHKAIDIKPGKITFECGTSFNYDICISTIPLPKMLELCRIVSILGTYTRSAPIYITRYKLNFPSTVHQTIYVPEFEYKTYRMTIERNDLIIEAHEMQADETEINHLIKFFGISYHDLCPNPKEYKMENGKIECLDDLARKKYIMKLTQDFSIYSFGRYGIWKPIRSEDMMSDLEKLKYLISNETIRRGL